MRIDRYIYNPSLSQSQVDAIANSLILPPSEFARIIAADGRMHGVETHRDRCDEDVGICVRERLFTLLVDAQQVAEQHLGFAFTERYLSETFRFDGDGRFQLSPNIESVNVAQTVTDLGGHTVSPYIESDITISDSGSDFCIAEVDVTLVDNPADVLIRDEDGLVYAQAAATGYPKRVDGVWHVPLGTTIVPPCTSVKTFNVQHARYMILEVAEPECSGEIVPTYPGTTQKIPLAKETQTLDGDVLQYWFHPWDLLDPAFFEDGADLEQGEFYKLLTTINLSCFVEAASLPVVTLVEQLSGETTFSTGEDETRIRILDAERGVVYIEYGNGTTCVSAKPFEVTVFYKVNPTIDHADISFGIIKDAIAYMAAANLPIKDCNCPAKIDYILLAQTPYDEVRINPVTGETILTPKDPVQNMYGKVIFWAKLGQIQSRRKLIML